MATEETVLGVVANFEKMVLKDIMVTLSKLKVKFIVKQVFKLENLNKQVIIEGIQAKQEVINIKVVIMGAALKLATKLVTHIVNLGIVPFQDTFTIIKLLNWAP